MSASDNWAHCPCCGDFLSRRQIERHLNEAYNAIDSDSDSNAIDSDLDSSAIPPENIADVEMVSLSEVMDPDELEPPALQATWRNPPVTVEVWDEPRSDSSDSNDEWSDLGEQPVDDDCDPTYVERDEPPRIDPDDEPRLTNDEMRELIELDFGDLLDDEWVDMYSRAVSERDLKTLKFLATRLRTHFSRATWDDLRFGACEELDLPSEFIAWRRLRILSGLETLQGSA
ncbi:unnamed protein product [Rhizoctonia solani]|uniref:Uncharacterized protein n=1 Tax=Rhizoctonia solani TaxID=456999 RepID=A0A8H3DTL9_9AGAM|nr:unnamed protein product [Rhizoctonia solani]CAE6539373.1 unnamed protein product [Rhizoctonia solani]